MYIFFLINLCGMQTLGINVVCETSDTKNFKFSLVVICSSGKQSYYIYVKWLETVYLHVII